MAQTALATAFVSIVPSAKGFGKKLQDDVDPELDAAGLAGGNKFGGGLLSGIKSFAGPIAAILGTVAIADFFKNSVKAASDLNESQNAIAVTFGDAADSIMKLGSNAATTLGLSNVQFNELAVRFSSFAKNIAGPGGNVTATLDEMTRRASDFASVMNIDVNEAAQVFQSGLAGETEPLKRFGIDLSDAAVKAYAAANGIGALGGQLTEAEKVQARYGLLMQSTSQVQGDFANTSDGLANGMRILKSSFEDVKANIGTAFLPFMAMGVQALNSFMGPLKEATQAFADFGKRIGEVFSGAGGGMAGFSAVMDNIAQSVSSFISSGGLFQAFAQLSALRTQIFNAIIEAMPGIINAMIDFLPQLISFITDTFIPQMVGQFASTVTAITDLMSSALPRLVYAIAGLLPVLVSAIAEMMPQVIAQILSLIPTLIDTGLHLFMSLVTALNVMIPVLLKAIIDALPPIVNSIISMLPGIIQSAIELFNGLIKGLIEIIPNLLTAILDALPDILKTLISMLPAILTGAITLFMGLVMGLVKILPDLLDTIVSDVIPSAIDAIVEMLPALIDGAVTLFIGIVEGITKATPQIISALIQMTPKLIGALLKTIPLLIDAGLQLLMGLAKGILDNAPRILGTIAKSIGDMLVGNVKAIFGIKSPSRVFYGIGGYITEGLANGIADGQGEVLKAMDKVNGLVDAGMTGSATISMDAPSVTSPLRDFQAALNANGNGQTVNYYAAPNQSIDSEQALFTAIQRAKVLAAW